MKCLFKSMLVAVVAVGYMKASTIKLPEYLPKMYSIQKSKEPKVLIVGGIHGDEYGGYLSALYLLKTLKTENGNISFLPFLNIKSMVVNFRYLLGGGDMNDKFVFSNHNDLKLPASSFRKIQNIKEKILSFSPDLVLSLHSGWGYSYEDPKRWGNSLVIDDMEYKGKKLYEKADIVLENINKHNDRKLFPYTIKVLKTFTENVKMDMNDLSTWILKNDLDVFTIESSKNQRIRTQVHNTTFAVLEFLELYGIKVINRQEMLSIENIKRFIDNIKQDRASFDIVIDGYRKTVRCGYKERKTVELEKNSTVEIEDVELGQLGYFIVPKSEKNYTTSYSFENNINFKVKYFNIDKKEYDDYCFVQFKVVKNPSDI